MKRRQRKNNESAISAGTNVDKYGRAKSQTVGERRNESKSKEQMKKDWGSKRATMKRKLG